VRITRPFYLGKNEITRGQFGAFVANTEYVTFGEKNHRANNWRKPGYAVTDEHPITYVSWDDAKAFCAWLAKHRGARDIGIKEIRLPTEAEWEYACRAGTTTRYYSGDRREDLRGVANLADYAYKRRYTFAAGRIVPWDDGYDYTAPVGKFSSNQFGLYDMIGNVGEWCEDYFGPYKYMPLVDPVRSVKHDGTFGSDRVWRGGSYRASEITARASHRSHEILDGGDPVDNVGFRVYLRLEK
jgi:formylglycine-generating enzyme required for sulfatase activity